MKTLSSEAELYLGQPMFRLLARANELENEGKEILHFEIGETNFRSPKEAVEMLRSALSSDKTHYVSSLGINELRDAVCEYTKKELGFRPSREQVLICPANAVIYLSIRCLVDKGMDVVYPDPGFSTWLSAIRLIGAKAVPVRLQQKNLFRLQTDDMEDLVNQYTRLIIVHSPSNPTGAVMTEEEVMKVAELAQRKDVYLLSDEAYSKLIYEGKHYSPSVYDQCLERTILLGSFSKNYSMTGWRLGYAIAPVKVIEKMGLLFQTIFSCFPPFIQWAGISVLEKCDYYNKWMVGELRKRRDLMVEGLNSIEGIYCVKPEGATYVFPNIEKTGLSSKEFADLMLERAGIALLSGTDFGKYGEGYVRLCFANTEDNINKCISKTREVLGDTRRVVPANIESYASTLR